MLSSIAVAVVAAAPLAAALAADIPVFEELRIQHLVARTTTDFAALTACIPPSSILEPSFTGLPTPPTALESIYITETDPCALETLSLPKSLSSEYASYSSAILSWYSKNKPEIQSYESVVSSVEASLRNNPTCSQFLAPSITSQVSLTTGLNICTRVTSGSTSGATSTSGSGSSGSGSASAASASGSSGAAASSSGSGSPGAAAGNLGSSRDTMLLLAGGVLTGCIAALAAL
ncbi:hypothetical protein NA57DRAFT_72945 [Rhizodiscina lignyota]|uniref:Infection structure specific protein n=1 Tax=Rhizodiscina lignyota TaxID=1504668 RepID=A0A9P4ILM5_9PEZI|nr:hypothetical protein NA57DRAFT_72945 [Rhizodiscina lignyota]